jgi:hypothetical protein
MPSAKKKILYLFVLMAQAGILHGQQTQPSQLFENFKTDKSRSLLPDFSYAGF